LLTGHAVTPEDLRSGGAASWFVYRLQPGATWLAAGWCHPSASGDPVFIPHDVEKRGVLTRIDPEPNSQVSDPFPPPPQVTDSAGSASQGGDTGSNPVGTTRSGAISGSREAPSPRIGPRRSRNRQRRVCSRSTADRARRSRLLDVQEPALMPHPVCIDGQHAILRCRAGGGGRRGCTGSGTWGHGMSDPNLPTSTSRCSEYRRPVDDAQPGAIRTGKDRPRPASVAHSAGGRSSPQGCNENRRHGRDKTDGRATESLNCHPPASWSSR
jgi:hypothetical protein